MPDRREQGRGTAKGGGLGPPPGATEPERGLETGGAEGAGEQGVLEVGWVSDHRGIIYNIFLPLG